MGIQIETKITWTVENFSSLQSNSIYSDPFVVGGCKWHLRAYPKGNNNATHLSLYLRVPDQSRPSGWKRHAKSRLTVVNQLLHKQTESKVQELDCWFDEKSSGWGSSSMCPLNAIYDKASGFLINDVLKIVVELEVLEVIGKLDVTEEIETMDVNGFLLLPSQAKYVSRMFERHQEIASEFRPKNPNLRTGYMSLLLSLIEAICRSPQEMSKDDLFDAYAALGSMRDAGFKLDWLEKKLDDVTEKKENEEASETRIQEMEEELKDLMQKSSNMKALVEEEKAKVSTAKATITFDDIVA